MFPTTVWTTIRDAAARDEAAWERFVAAYRAPVRAWLRAKGAPPSELDDLCQEVFVQCLAGVLARADAGRGRFRALLSTVTRRAFHQRLRRRGDEPCEELDPAAPDADFDREWTLALVERALRRLEADDVKQHRVLAEHLAGAPQDRQRLWLARRRLRELLRAEVAETCACEAELEEELAHLAPYLRPRGSD